MTAVGMCKVEEVYKVWQREVYASEESKDMIGGSVGREGVWKWYNWAEYAGVEFKRNDSKQYVQGNKAEGMTKGYMFRGGKH